MTDEELRALVRRMVAERLGRPACPTPGAEDESLDRSGDTCQDHPSHAVYVSVVNVGDMCVIEPGVACHHCDYCRSHGH